MTGAFQISGFFGHFSQQLLINIKVHKESKTGGVTSCEQLVVARRRFVNAFQRPEIQ
jgi:hypothetical protein